MIGRANRFFVFDPARIDKTVEFTNRAYDTSLRAPDVYTNDFVDKLPNPLKAGQLP